MSQDFFTEICLLIFTGEIDKFLTEIYNGYLSSAGKFLEQLAQFLSLLYGYFIFFFTLMNAYTGSLDTNLFMDIEIIKQK